MAATQGWIGQATGAFMTCALAGLDPLNGLASIEHRFDRS